jgi:hypothetical protein
MRNLEQQIRVSFFFLFFFLFLSSHEISLLNDRSAIVQRDLHNPRNEGVTPHTLRGSLRSKPCKAMCSFITLPVNKRKAKRNKTPAHISNLMPGQMPAITGLRFSEYHQSSKEDSPKINYPPTVSPSHNHQLVQEVTHHALPGLRPLTNTSGTYSWCCHRMIVDRYCRRRQQIRVDCKEKCLSLILNSEVHTLLESLWSHWRAWTVHQWLPWPCLNCALSRGTLILVTYSRWRKVNWARASRAARASHLLTFFFAPFF